MNNTTQLVADDVIADVESYLADYDIGVGLDLESAAQVYALVVEVAAHVRMLRQTKLSRNGTTACSYLERAATAMLALLDEHGAVADRAEEILNALPVGGRRQALQAVQDE